MRLFQKPAKAPFKYLVRRYAVFSRARYQSVKNRVQNGTYRVDSLKVAEKILQEELLSEMEELN